MDGPAVISLFKTFSGILFKDRSSLRFAFGVTIGISFSMAVILATIGIMDGFDESLKINLKKSLGDISISYRDGFLYMSGGFAQQLREDESEKIGEFSFILKNDGFLIAKGTSRGVQINGIDPSVHSDILKMQLNILPENVAIGIELANDLDLSVGDEVVVAMSSGNESIKNLPILNRFIVGQIVNHGIYLKDSRTIYMNLEKLQNILKLGDKANVLTFNIKTPLKFEEDVAQYSEKVKEMVGQLKEKLGIDYSVRAFWHEYSGLLEAVRVEKFMIGLVLQIIVVVSMFNMLAFLIYVNEKYVKEIFLLRALGLTKKRLTQMWLGLVTVFWMISSTLSYFFVKLINLALQKLTFLKVPGEIYYLNRFKIILNSNDYFMVLGLSLFWIFIISIITLYRLHKTSLLHGLRREFA